MPRQLTVHDRTAETLPLRLQRELLGNRVGIFLLLALWLPLATSAAVTNYIWVGLGNPGVVGNARWNRAGNWTNASPLANYVGGLTNTDITFQGNLKLSPSMENDYYIRSLTFAANAGAFTLSSQCSAVLKIGAGGILNQSANTQTILSSLSLSNSQTWNALAGNLVIQGGVNLGNKTLTIAGAKDISLTGVIQGSGQIIKQDAGVMTLGGTAANTYSGGTILNSGTLTLAKVNALGSGSLTINSGVLNLGNYNQNLGLFFMTGGTVNGGTGTLTASDYEGQSGTINAKLAGSGSFTKSGAGTLTLTAANTYSGGTSIDDGTLKVNNLTGSGTGSGNVWINNGGTLAGRGGISGNVINSSGGTISPGDGVGQLSTSTELWWGGSAYRWEINNASSTAGVGWDLLNVSGMLNILAFAGNTVSVDVISLTSGGVPGPAANFNPSLSYLWKIIQTTDGINLFLGNESTLFNLNTGGFANSLNGGAFSLSRSGNGQDLYLAFTPSAVPEPDKLALIGLGACTFIYGRRFQRLRRSARRPTIRPLD